MHFGFGYKAQGVTGQLKSTTTRHGTGNQRTILTISRHDPGNLEMQRIRREGSTSLGEKVMGPPDENEMDKSKSKAGKANIGTKTEDVEASDVRLKAEREGRKRNAKWEACIESHMQPPPSFLLSSLALGRYSLVWTSKILLKKAASFPGMNGVYLGYGSVFLETMGSVLCLMENCYTCKVCTARRFGQKENDVSGFALKKF
ncbi:hypothetical protein B0T13DRAFT_474260 [Neurospora crassa]|nr:hypothetical protein B0T13DRAFT_474260 [Neurospora crassa]